PSEIRRRAKAINFGIIYGISAFGLANQLGIPREEAGAYIKKYFERFPGIRAYMDSTRDFCRAHGYVETLKAKKLQAQMLLQVHDELIFEVPDNEVAATLPVVQHVMQDAPFPAVLLSLPLQVDARAANNWDEAHS